MPDKIDDKEQIKIPEAEKISISPDVQKTAEELLVKVETDQKLDKLEDQIIDPELKKIFEKIDGEKEMDDQQDKTFAEVQKLMQEHKTLDAASKVLGWLIHIFFKAAEKPGLEKYENIKDDIDFASLDDAKLQDYIHDMESKIDATTNYNKKTQIYILS